MEVAEQEIKNLRRLLFSLQEKRFGGFDISDEARDLSRRVSAILKSHGLRHRADLRFIRYRNEEHRRSAFSQWLSDNLSVLSRLRSELRRIGRFRSVPSIRPAGLRPASRNSRVESSLDVMQVVRESLRAEERKYEKICRLGEILRGELNGLLDMRLKYDLREIGDFDNLVERYTSDIDFVKRARKVFRLDPTQAAESFCLCRFEDKTLARVEASRIPARAPSGSQVRSLVSDLQKLAHPDRKSRRRLAASRRRAQSRAKKKSRRAKSTHEVRAREELFHRSQVKKGLSELSKTRKQILKRNLQAAAKREYTETSESDLAAQTSELSAVRSAENARARQRARTRVKKARRKQRRDDKSRVESELVAAREKWARRDQRIRAFIRREEVASLRFPTRRKRGHSNRQVLKGHRPLTPPSPSKLRYY